MLFAFKKKSKTPPFGLEKFESIVRLLKDSPAHSEAFPEVLSYIAKLAQARGAALYLYEDKTDVFLLKTWAGEKPVRMTLAGDYEFIKYLHRHGNPAARRDFTAQSHELRQTALFRSEEHTSELQSQ